MRFLIRLALLSAVTVPATSRALAATPFEGRWQLPTTATRFHFAHVVHDFVGDRTTMTLFLGAALPYQANALKIVRTGRLEVIGPSAAVAGATEVDVTVESITITPLDPDSVFLANEDGSELCDVGGWERGVAKEVSGKTCSSNRMSAAGEVEKIIVKVDGDRLWLSPYWGDGAVVPAVPAAAVRAATLDTKRPLERVHAQ
jgi:hypothetical protein